MYYFYYFSALNRTVTCCRTKTHMNYKDLYVSTDQVIQRGQCGGAQLNFGFLQQTINKCNAVKTQLTRHTGKPTAAGHCRLRSVSQVTTTKLDKRHPRSEPQFVGFVSSISAGYNPSRQHLDRLSANHILQPHKKTEEQQQTVNFLPSPIHLAQTNTEPIFS